MDSNADAGSVADGQATATTPVLPIPPRAAAAVEHPALLTSLSRGIASFAGRADYDQVVRPAGPHVAVPVFLRYEDPASSMLLSHKAATHNVVLAVHVPRRTGRRRRRGVPGAAWEGDVAMASPSTSGEGQLPGDTLDQRDARLLRRKLRDTAGLYQTEVVGLVKHSHRYRGTKEGTRCPGWLVP